MFFFGETTSIADLFFDRAVTATTGPIVTGTDPEDMSEKEIAGYIVYCRMAYKHAVKEKAPEEVLDELLARHDRVFALYAQKSETFRKFLLTGRHEWLGGYTTANKKKYLELAGLSSAN